MPWNFILDPSKPGLRKVLKEYEELALRYFWNENAEDVAPRMYGPTSTRNWERARPSPGRALEPLSTV